VPEVARSGNAIAECAIPDARDDGCGIRHTRDVELSGTTIRVVDDDEVIRDALRMALSCEGGWLFRRFYRSPEARALPGSALGLAIVDKVARDHGGRPFARNHGHGATVGFTVHRNFDPAKQFEQS
jgi:signal transduction histidine kinase